MHGYHINLFYLILTKVIMANDKKIIISSNTLWSIENFRISLIKQLKRMGYEVIVLATSENYEELKSKPIYRYINLRSNMLGTNPFFEASLFLKYCYIFYKERPSIYLGFTIKPNLYGSLAAALFNISVVNNVTGIGRAFLSKSHVQFFIKIALKLAFKKSKRIFFQNTSDLNFFVREGIVSRGSAELLPGSGVDLKKFTMNPIANKDNKFRFLFIGRLIKSKGIYEYVEAAKSLKVELKNAQFIIAGKLDFTDPSAIDLDYFLDAIGKKVITYLGNTDDIATEIRRSTCVVLPSYQEGMSRALLEAGSIGRAMIGSNIPGILEIIMHDYNGFLVEKGNRDDLIEKMRAMYFLPIEKIKDMGLKSRRLIEEVFDEEIVINKYSNVILECSK